MSARSARDYDVIVVGGGHAGCEAALASARMGLHTAMVTLDPSRIAHLPCNCSIGGPAKGHLAREVDALGGEMCVTTDATLTHIREVGTGKGPAVRTLRAHVDTARYPAVMQRTIAATPGLDVVEAQVQSLLFRPAARESVHGILLEDGREFTSSATVITAGTFMHGLMHCGHERTSGGRHGEPTANSLAASVAELGLRTARFKTGTTPRLDALTIDYSMAARIDSEPCEPFSFVSDALPAADTLLPCWQVHTNLATHGVIRSNLARSAMYSGRIEGTGPRFCPSIEDKVVRFADKAAHPVFLEFETADGRSVYVQGMSTSLPADVQLEFVRTIPALRDAAILRPGYAVEYDVVLPDQLLPTLQARGIDGLYFAGQVNGTSGYEEAAAQGIMAGINAALSVEGREPLVLRRDEAYIGVLIDDLVTRGVSDPYRMLTSRAEFRLNLRHDNADRRLTAAGRRVGAVGDTRFARWQAHESEVARLQEALRRRRITPHDRIALGARGVAVSDGWRGTAFDLTRRPDVDPEALAAVEPEIMAASARARREVSVSARFEGYIAREIKELERFHDAETISVPADTDYAAVRALSHEGREKLEAIRPGNIGQAQRIPGIRPGDVQALAIHVAAKRRAQGMRPALKD